VKGENKKSNRSFSYRSWRHQPYDSWTFPGGQTATQQRKPA